MFIISNDNLLKESDLHISFQEVLKRSKLPFLELIKAISKISYNDFKGIKETFSNAGFCKLGIGKDWGINAIHEAFQKSVQELSGFKVPGLCPAIPKKVLVIFSSASEVNDNNTKIEEAVNIIKSRYDQNTTKVYFYKLTDPTLEGNEIKIICSEISGRVP